MVRITERLKLSLLMQLKPDQVGIDQLTTATIETGALCNLNCPLCATGNGTFGLSREFLTKDKLVRILDSLGPRVRAITFYRLGDPLLNPDFAEMASLASGRGIALFASTNLSFSWFDERSAERLLGAGLTYLKVACDGASQRTYRQFRVGGDFDLVMRNLRLLLEAKRRRASQWPRIVWQFLVHRGNQHELALAEEMARGMGVTIEFAKIIAPPQLEDQWNPDRAAAPPPSEPASLHGEEPAPAWEASNRVINTTGLDSSEKCLSIWEGPHIHSDGTVLPCCMVFTSPRFGLGNIFKEPLAEIWNKPLAVAMRRYLKSGLKPATELPCYGCALNPHASRPPDA